MSLKSMNIGLNLFSLLKIMLFDRDISTAGKFYFCKPYINTAFSTIIILFGNEEKSRLNVHFVFLYHRIAVARIRKIFLNMRDTVKKEFQLIFGLVQLCNICTFIDDSQRNKEEGSFFVWIECIDKNMIRDDVENKEKAGLIEVKQSRSKDITLRQKQTLILKVDGQVKLRLADPPDAFKITYLIGADNHVNIPMEVHRDQEKIPYAAFAFYEEDCAHPFHSVNIPVRDLSELPTGSYVMIKIQKLYCFSLNCFLKKITVFVKIQNNEVIIKNFNQFVEGCCECFMQ